MTHSVSVSDKVSLANRYHTVKERIQRALVSADRTDNSTQLLAVSKTRPAASLRELFTLGQRDFGENYLQEALEKQQQLQDLAIEWHFIGPIQSNKTRAIAEHFSWVHSVDRLKVAKRLNDQRPTSLPPLNICLQVNIDGEASKSGITAAELPSLIDEIKALPRLRLRGLMSIPSSENAKRGTAHQQLKLLFDAVDSSGLSDWDTLSMGMSADLEPAIHNGSTMVRIGTDLFGPRTQVSQG